MEELLDWLESFHPLSEGLREYLVQNLGYKTLEKKEFLLKIGHSCRHIYFIEKGSFRSFYFHNDTEVNNGFMFGGDPATVFHSFIRQSQSDEAIQALEDSSVYYLSYDQLKELVKSYPELVYISVKILIEQYGLSLLLMRCLRVSNKQERYFAAKFLFPKIMDNVFQKDVATFLGLHNSYISNFKPEEEKRRHRSERVRRPR